MQFAVPAEHYDRFMGRYAPSLAVALCDAAGVTAGLRVCDVGCGPGGLTAEMVARAGADRVAAIDPAPQFAQACKERNEGVDVRVGVAEHLPWPDDMFDVTAASLVIGFMADPDLGVREMARVTRPGGTVAACMWDIATGGMTMLRVFWSAVRGVAPDATGESTMAGTTEGDIADRFHRAGLDEVIAGTLTAHADYTDFDDFWDPFTLEVGPAGRFLQTLTSQQRSAVRDACRAALPTSGAFTLDARAWYARGTIPPAG